MEEKKQNIRFKTFRKIVLRTLLVFLILLFSAGIALSLPSVQTYIAHYFTEKINKDFGTNINVKEVEITIFGGVQLKKVLIKDEKKDTLIFAKRIATTIVDAKKLLDGDLIFGAIKADELLLNIKTYKGDRDTNLDKFVASFDKGSKKSTKKFLMTSNQVTLINSRFVLNDYNRLNSKDVDFKNLNVIASNFKILGPDVTTNIQEMSFKDYRGLEVENLKSKFTYTKKNIRLEELDLKTKESNFNGEIILKYDRKDFANFNNKVLFDVKTKKATIASNDIRYFYKELGKNHIFSLEGKIEGTLNDFTAKNLYLIDSNKSEIKGDINFKNLFAKEDQGNFYMKGTFDKVASSYDGLTVLLPSVLGKKLPSSLKKIGKFNLAGSAEITTKTIDATFELKTKIGNVSSQLIMSNIDNIDNAKYEGNIVLDNFDLGTYLGRKDLGRVSIDVDVNGKGFTKKYLDTKFSGEVKNIVYNGYNYKNIIADGSFKKPYFKGKVNINDPNLFIDFEGLVDSSKKENVYDFKAKVDYINLKRLNFLKDSIAVFKGDVLMKIAGNSLNTINGEVIISNASYQNKKDIYFFDNVILNSSFDAANEHTISVYSPENIKGELKGKFEFEQIQKMVQNSLGSLYTNYKQKPIKKGQYLNFNFSEFNKIIEILNPDISLNDDALVNGLIKSDDNYIKLEFTTKSIDLFDNRIDNVLLEIDNKNPLYNTYIQLDSIKTKHYKVRDFSLINATSKDTLSFRTEFKGGNKGQDYFNLNLYHTIDKENKNVIGFSKSEMMFKDFLWYINEEESDKSKVIFDNDFKTFTFDDFIVSHENQFLKLSGLIEGKYTKDLKLTFNEVDLNKITPDINQFKFEGRVNGDIKLIQDNAIYQPTAALEINDLFINENELGKLNLEIEGNEDFSKFDLISTIENENFKSFAANGDLQIKDGNTFADLQFNFQKFNLGVLSNLGGDVISNIRGMVSGFARINGNVNDISYNGRLFVDDAGLTIPYLNVDYGLKPNTVVDVTKNSFEIKPTILTDTKFNTEGSLVGIIKHKEFAKWELDLEIDSDRIIALNTRDSEDAAYFGKAFINGNATIKGPTNGLVINVNATSEKGTDIKIPINESDAISESSYIHYSTKEEKYNRGNKNESIARNYNGLQMNFEFDITKDANIEVILDRNSGHGMKGVGEGGLVFRINTLGDFNMWGDFIVEKGAYNFKWGGLIDKKFAVKKNGYISWAGDPFKAVLNLQAVYETAANPDLLLGNASFNRKIPVEVLIDLKGTIANPEPDFNIDFPNVNSVVKSEIETQLADKDTRSRQAMVLLSTGSFLSQEGLSQAQYTNFAFEKASALFGDIFNDEGGKTQVGVTYLQSDRTQINPIDSRVEATISSQLNDRITFNGKVGVPLGGVNQSTVVGNVEIQYRVNDDGTLNLRFFNKENDINFIGQGIGYTQGVGVSYEVDFDTFNELVKKIFGKKAKRVNLINSTSVPDDSEVIPDYVGIKTKEEKERQKQKEKEQRELEQNQNRHAVPLDD